MSRGFAGGLAEGINQGMQMYALSESLQARKKAEARADAGEARAAEDHQIKMQQHASNRKLSETMASVLGWTPEMAGGSPTNPDAPSMGAPAQPPETPSAIKLAGPIPQGGLAMNAPASTMAPYAADNPAGALAPQQAPQARQAEPISADKFIQKQILTGNAFGNPQVLNKLAAASFEAGQGEKALAFLNMAHQAHEKGLTQAMAKLMEGDGKGAADIIRSRGTNLEGDLVPVEGKEHVWKGVVDGKEREFNVREMAGAANPMEWFAKADEAKHKAAELALKQKEDARQEQDQANKNKESESKLKTDATQRTLNLANAGKASRSPVSAKVSTKGIERANAERHKQFDLYATGEDDTGKQKVNPEKRQAINRATYEQEKILKQTLKRDLEPDEIREVTDAMLDYPHGGTKEEIRKWQAGFLDRFNIDEAASEAPAAVAVADASKLGEGKPPPETKPAPLAKEPTREEQELEAVKFDEADRRRMRELQTDRTASNLSEKQRRAVDDEIAALIAKHSTKKTPAPGLKTAARNRAPSSDPEVAPAGYGKRRDGTEKGTGWLGVQKTKSGKDMTEYTVGLNIDGKDVDVPTLVPGLTDKELAYLKTEPSLKERTPINESILRKAAEHAKKRLREGKSVFANNP